MRYMMDKLRFGTAGKPISTKGDTVQGIKDVRKLNLDAMELEFVHSINNMPFSIFYKFKQR